MKKKSKGSKVKGKFPAFTTPTVLVAWGHLNKPDDRYTPNHNITVFVDANLEKLLKKHLKATGAKKLNGLGTDKESGKKTAKFKSTLFVDEGSFPCKDSRNKACDASPFGGDKVRLQLKPSLLEDGTCSMYLNGCQIIEKNANASEGGSFEKVKGYVGKSKKDEDEDELDEEELDEEEESEDEDEDSEDEDTDEDEESEDEDADEESEDDDEDADEDDDEDSEDEDEDADDEESEDEDEDEGVSRGKTKKKASKRKVAKRTTTKRKSKPRGKTTKRRR